MSGEVLAEEHWKYTEKILNVADCEEDLIERFKVIYLESFVHGYKHGVDECQK